MGRKNRRMRWRTLTITDEQISDSDESTTTATTIIQDHQRSSRYSTKSSPYHYGNNNKTHYQNGGRYTYSSQSTPIRRYHQSNHHNNNNNNNNNRNAPSTKSTRSNSTTSENKVTFNEDEYTRITTPRQDVLFKKGYLNKPKILKTQTSTGTSSTTSTTGNGTPDHQSTDLEYESQFVFPNGFVDQNGIYYINSYEPYPVMVYNPAPYYTDFTSNTKRSSTGSLTESTSPNNEEVSQDQSQDGGGGSTTTTTNGGSYYNIIYPGFYYNGTTITSNTNTNDDESTITTEGDCETVDNTRRLPKKKKRRKSNEDEDEDTSSLSSSSNDDNDDDDDHVITDDAQKLLMNGLVKDADNSNDNHNSAVVDNDNNVSDNDKEDDDDKKYDLKPDAEEFIPRAYRQPLPPPPTAPVFLPLPPIDFNGHTYLPHGIPINFIPTQPLPVTTEQQQNQQHQNDFEEEDEQDNREDNEENCKDCGEKPEILPNNNNNNNNGIDIAKIVSKLEEAAKEQNEDATEEKKIAATEDGELKKNDEKAMKNHRKLNRKHHQNPEIYSSNSSRKRNWKNTQPLPNSDHNLNHHNDNGRKYSETLKKVLKAPLQQHQQQQHEQIVGRIEKKEALSVKIEDRNEDNDGRKPSLLLSSPKVGKQQKNQWISVSNRKKRKNRSQIDDDSKNEDYEEETTEEATVVVVEEEKDEDKKEDGDLFENYDVHLLEDVIVVKKEEIEDGSKMKQKVVEEDKPSVVVVVAEKTNEVEKEFKTINRKKNKKANNNNKTTAVRRVIVTDIDLSHNFEETIKSTPKEQIADKCEVKEESPPIVAKADTNADKPEVKQQEPVCEKKTTTTTATAQKKRKKKKSKIQSATNSRTSSTLTLNIIDDNSYDFLLETFDNKTNDKTNIEISEELDKIIQKGIYSNLEEKIKSLKQISDNDRQHDDELHDHEDNDFFKTVMNNISKTTTTVTTTKTIKSPDFTKLLKPSIFNHNHNNNDNDNKKVTGDFLGITTPIPQHSGGSYQQQQQQQQQYPVTEAVKKWITRTRETTPELEILKSPQTILEEFAEQFVQEDNDDDHQKNVITSPLAPLCNNNLKISERGDDEITIFARNKNDKDDDNTNLLQYWDDFNDKNDKIKTIDDITVDNDNNNNNEDDDDGNVEIYDSKYGNNEDYLKIKAEIDENLQHNDRYNGNLPYRAICCSIM